jgi:N-acylglucosamine 2-epimerase
MPFADANLRTRIDGRRARLEDELTGSVIPFWMKHAPDREHGGWFDCLDRDGTVWDTRKHIWLQGRAVWMLSKLHAELEPRPEFLAQAKSGAQFLREHCRRPDRRVWFCTTRDGRPVQLQRKIFSECFYVMAMAQYARVSGEAWAAKEAREVFGWILEAIADPRLAGRAREAGEPATRSLAVPMIVLNLIQELDGGFHGEHAADARRCAADARQFLRRDRKVVLETIAADGSDLDSPEGRLLNPGHAIEMGWFLLDHARATGDEACAKDALDAIEWSLERGWDPVHGGLYYFLDEHGRSPAQLEWPMKLWWPHCEALVACAKAFEHTRDRAWFERWVRVADWTFARFPDAAHGEWFGYLDRQGAVSQRFKGGPYKGFFHVPRALLYTARALKGALEPRSQAPAAAVKKS